MYLNKYNTDNVKRNKYYKNKKVHKISLITDLNGIALHITFNNGNENDITILKEQLNEWNNNIDPNIKLKLENTTFMADTGYDGSLLREK